jgi:hypothetical protein
VIKSHDQERDKKRKPPMAKKAKSTKMTADKVDAEKDAAAILKERDEAL